MAVRVDDEEVEAIIDVESHIDTNAFIATANIMVDEYLADEGLGDSILIEIEKYLAAHFIAIRQGILKAEDFGDAKDEYAIEVGKGLDATPYGQQVKVLDPSGLLASSTARRAGIATIEIDYGVD
jgi:hypothetical protein